MATISRAVGGCCASSQKPTGGPPDGHIGQPAKRNSMCFMYIKEDGRIDRIIEKSEDHSKNVHGATRAGSAFMRSCKRATFTWAAVGLSIWNVIACVKTKDWIEFIRLNDPIESRNDFSNTFIFKLEFRNLNRFRFLKI